jgi:hypothetical protein
VPVPEVVGPEVLRPEGPGATRSRLPLGMFQRRVRSHATLPGVRSTHREDDVRESDPVRESTARAVAPCLCDGSLTSPTCRIAHEEPVRCGDWAGSSRSIRGVRWMPLPGGYAYMRSRRLRPWVSRPAPPTAGAPEETSSTRSAASPRQEPRRPYGPTGPARVVSNTRRDLNRPAATRDDLRLQAAGGGDRQVARA